jgi:sec-independent protein translocase protein TatC
LAIMMGVTTRRWLETRRLYFWGGFLTIAFFFSPDPTGMAPIIVGLTMVILFEGTLALLRWTGAGSMSPGVEEAAGLRPLVWTVLGVAGYLASPAPLPSGYYDQFPTVVTDALATLGLVDATPIIVGGGLIALYEGANYLLRRIRAPLRVRLLLARVRVPFWLLAVAVGYLASPDPDLLADVNRTLLSTTETLVVFGGLLVLYEGALLLWRWRSGRGGR